MNARERLERILAGERPDRPAVSLWRHFYHRESNADDLVAAMVEFQREYQWDFMKINPRASYHVEDWGNTLAWSSDENTKHTKLTYAVNELDDWSKIQKLPTSSPVLRAHRDVVWKIRKAVGPDLPLFMTVFNPISVASYLAPSPEIFRDHLNRDKEAVLGAIARIAATYLDYVRELRDAGADGIFLATTSWAARSSLTLAEYQELARPFDLALLAATDNEGFNIWHVCESDNYLTDLLDYPARLVNWDESHPANLSLRDAFDVVGDKTVIGGIDHLGWLQTAEPAEIDFKVREMAVLFRGRRLIFGPGCTISPQTPAANIAALRRAVETLTRR